MMVTSFFSFSLRMSNMFDIFELILEHISCVPIQRLHPSNDTEFKVMSSKAMEVGQSVVKWDCLAYKVKTGVNGV